MPAGKSSCEAVERHVVEPDDVRAARAWFQIFIFRQVQVLAAECGVVSGTFENRLRVRVLKHQPATSARLSGVDAVDEQLAFLLAFVISTEHAGQTGHQG